MGVYERLDDLNLSDRVSRLFNDSANIVFDERLNIASTIQNENEFELELDENLEYDFTDINPGVPLRGQIFDRFQIKLGTDEIPRFSCANHKCNIAIRMAIKSHADISRVLIKLSR